ncbi:hypothetical protein [Hydrogenimonas sp.]
MVRILSLAIAAGLVPLFACSGDCLACHPVLKKSIDAPHHRVIKRCIECHKGRSTGASSCGSDCFDCHDRNRLARSSLPEHRAIAGCARCHISPKELMAPGDPFSLP